MPNYFFQIKGQSHGNDDLFYIEVVASNNQIYINITNNQTSK